MEVDRGDGVEKGTAGDEEGLDYHWTVVRQTPQRSAFSS